MEEKDDLETRVANMTREERLARMRELLVPMRQHLHNLDDEQADAKVTTIEGGARRRRRQPSCRSWCASSPKDPVIAQSPAYHDHQPHRLLLNLSDATDHCRAICPGLRHR